jgi:hypothetical protein
VKRFLLALLYVTGSICYSNAQTPQDSLPQQRDTVRPRPAQPKPPLRSAAADSLKQRQDSIKNALRADSLKRVADSLRRAADSIRRVEEARPKYSIPAIQAVLASHRWYKFFEKPVSRQVELRNTESKDDLFYFLCGLVIYFTIIKLAFGKYLSNLLTLFFRVTMRQQQLRDQLLQTPIASLLLNILFVLSMGLYLSFIAIRYRFTPFSDLWVTMFWCSALISAIYLGKLIVLKIIGWIFNISNATDTYIFIVFLVNKMIGMFLLPFLFLLAFPHPVIYPVALTLSVIMVVMLFGYRFVISYRPLRNEIKLGKFQFFIYLCAFEVAPLLLIYKVLLNFVESSF